ncbi:MAG: NAD(P)-dependent alcohol dehydrogenase [Chlamydiae bacterium]|nr:NAD(P)-dependent alcohol dehydrogenase [Chlamydiota bacterium]
MKNIGYAAGSATTPLDLHVFETREMRDHDVLIDILFCGICHSDLHMVKNEWRNTIYPIVPGHEIVGRVSKIGSDATSFKEGDLVAVGCIIGSCASCSSCQKDLEQYCEKGFTLTFNTKDPISGSMNYGGFARQIVVEDKYVLKVPVKFQEKDLAAVAPLLCAGITTYSPLRNWKVSAGSKVGIVGLGGLGHLAVKLAHAMGAHVTVFTTSQDKVEEAKKLGADEVVYSKDPKAMSAHKNTLDFLLSCVSFPYDLNPFLDLLTLDGTMCLVGLPASPHPSLRADLLINKRRRVAGSLIGGIKETQELLEFCAEHNILAEIELISIDMVNEAFERMLKSDVKYRFVIDMKSLQ